MDEDDKVRRNLVVFSAATVLLFWLEIPVQPLLEEHLKIEPASTLRAWVAAACVLAYLTLRYRFSPDAEKLRDNIAQSRQGIIYQNVSNILSAQIRMAYTQGGDVQYAINSTIQTNMAPLNDLPIKSWREAQAWMHENKYELASISIELTSYAECTGKFSVIFNSPPLSQVVRSGQYKLPLLKRVRVKLLAAKPYIYSGVAINQLAPYVLALAAGVVITYRIAQSAA